MSCQRKLAPKVTPKLDASFHRHDAGNNMQHTIRKALLSDLKALITLENTIFTTDRMSPKSIRDALKKSSAEILIAELNNEIIGAAILFFRKNSKKARIYSIAVYPAHHGQGIALDLHNAIEKVATQRGCNQLILEVRIDNPRAIQFYKKLSYETYGNYPEFYEDGTDAKRMRKVLNMLV